MRFLMNTTLMVAIATLSLTACNNDEDTGGTMAPIDPPDVVIETGTYAPTEPDSCCATDLCLRSIDECQVNLELDECEAWYALDDAACADMAAYEACNCDCLSQPTCDGYFSCGEICFNDFCQ